MNIFIQHLHQEHDEAQVNFQVDNKWREFKVFFLFEQLIQQGYIVLFIEGWP